MSTEIVTELKKTTSTKNASAKKAASSLETEAGIRIIRNAIRDVPDFPKPGILFRDITPALADPKVFAVIIELIAEECRRYNPSKVLGIEARGFIIGAAVAARMEVGFVPVRKPGKLPAKVYSADYELEYGKDSVEMQKDALTDSDRVVIIDDLLATGGTVFATCDLVEAARAKVESIVCLIDLAFLPWRKKLSGRNVKTFVTYED